MAEIFWTTESTIELIKEYRKYPELWDPNHELYRVQTSKYAAWTKFAHTFDCDIADLRQKLNSIFASHRREKAKVRNGKRSTWFLYTYMSFLPSHLENNEESLEVQQRNEELEQSSDNDGGKASSEEEVLIKQEPVTEHYIIAEKKPHAKRPLTRKIKSNRYLTKRKPVQQNNEEFAHSSDNDGGKATSEDEVLIKQEPVTEHYILTKNKKPRPLTRKLKSNRYLTKRKPVTVPSRDSNISSTLDSRLLETLRLLKKSDLSKKKDECDSFGEYIAISLRKHDDRTQSMIKQAINNILFEQEMKRYNTLQYTVELTGADENPLVLGDNDEQ